MLMADEAYKEKRFVVRVFCSDGKIIVQFNPTLMQRNENSI